MKVENIVTLFGMSSEDFFQGLSIKKDRGFKLVQKYQYRELTKPLQKFANQNRSNFSDYSTLDEIKCVFNPDLSLKYVSIEFLESNAAFPAAVKYCYSMKIYNSNKMVYFKNNQVCDENTKQSAKNLFDLIKEKLY